MVCWFVVARHGMHTHAYQLFVLHRNWTLLIYNHKKFGSVRHSGMIGLGTCLLGAHHSSFCDPATKL